MSIEEMIAEYLKATSVEKTRIETQLTRIAEILRENDITSPFEKDTDILFDTLVIPELMKKYPGLKKGTPMSLKTAKDYKKPYKDMQKWYKARQERDITMDLMQTENEKEVKSGISAADMATKENDSTAVEPESQPVQAEAEPESMSNEAHEVPLPEQPELQAEPAKAVSQRGRKPKPENENRVQISAYLNRAVYEGVKALSDASNQTISDIVAKAIEAFYEENREMIEESIRLVALQESIKARIKYTKR